MHLPALLCGMTQGASASAQTAAGADGPITYGHHHLNVTSVAEHKRFWIDALGGTLVKIGATENVLFPGVLVRLRPQPPSGGTNGTTVHHVSFAVPNVRKAIETLRSQGYPIITHTEVTSVKPADVKDGVAYSPDERGSIAFTMGPDNTTVELFENTALAVPIAMHHVHFAAADTAAVKAWYQKIFGAAPGRGDHEAELPGVLLRWTASATAPAGTRGRVLDHIGFEVRGLEEFCRKLAATGITFDRPYSKVPDLGIAVAFLTDPWGTYIELTEGLRKLVE